MCANLSFLVVQINESYIFLTHIRRAHLRPFECLKIAHFSVNKQKSIAQAWTFSTQALLRLFQLYRRRKTYTIFIVLFDWSRNVITLCRAIVSFLVNKYTYNVQRYFREFLLFQCMDWHANRMYIN